MGQLPIVNDVVPEDVEEILNELQNYGDPTDVTDEDAGLRFQYRVGIVNKDDLLELLDEQKKLKDMIDKGLFVP